MCGLTIMYIRHKQPHTAGTWAGFDLRRALAPAESATFLRLAVRTAVQPAPHAPLVDVRGMAHTVGRTHAAADSSYPRSHNSGAGGAFDVGVVVLGDRLLRGRPVRHRRTRRTHGDPH